MTRALADAEAVARAVAAVEALGPLDVAATAAATARLDGLTKPPGSLGRLESIVVTLAGITGRPDVTVDRRAVIIAAADHGVARQGVSAYPQEVTAQMVANFLAGGAAISVLAARAGATLTVIDVGVAGEIPAVADTSGRGGRLVSARVRAGTADMTAGPAMSRDETLAAIAVGLGVGDAVIARGVDLLAIGEMGIGNTTAASALTAILTATPHEQVTGPGTGLDAAGLARKRAAVGAAISVNAPDATDPVGVLAAVGGLEIAALVGVIVAAVAARVPVLLDGFITGAAALVAAALAPGVAPRLLAAHRSAEPGHAVILHRLGLAPLLDLDLRLGEGSGAVLGMDLVSAAVAIRDGMATFASAGVSGRGGDPVPEYS